MALVMNRIITIDLLVHRKTGLMVAVSPEMKGLIVHGDSERELTERIPVAIRSLLEADGHTVESVTPVVEAAPNAPPDFSVPVRKFQAIAA